MQELKFTKTIRQRFDFSCGSAALATLLTYHYERERNELQIFKKMWEAGDQKVIKKGGFSMLDMKRFVESEGLRAGRFQGRRNENRRSGRRWDYIARQAGYAPLCRSDRRRRRRVADQ